MPVFRVEKNSNYTTMCNYHLRDQGLSLKGKGLLSMLLSLPDTWNYSVRGLSSITPDGVDGVLTALKELERLGYLERNQQRESNGRMGRAEYVIYEMPRKKPCSESPCTENPYTVNSDMDEVTTDDLRLLLVPISKQSASLYSKMNMLIKCVFYSAEESKIISYNPAASLSAKGGTPKQEKKALTDEQVKILLDTIRGLPPYVFVMIGLYAGLRREEILALRWDCVFLDEATPYISVRRAWRSVNNRPVISTELKTPAAKRDIPIPGKLVECLKEAKEKSKSEYVISDRNGNALAESQFVRVWKYIAVRSTEERCYYTYVNGQKIKHVVKPKLGEHQPNNPKLVYTMDFQVTPHQLRHTYITNLIYASVDPKTVQYLAGHENSKVTMDIYAKVKYNKPAQLHGVINRAIDTSKKD